MSYDNRTTIVGYIAAAVVGIAFALAIVGVVHIARQWHRDDLQYQEARDWAEVQQPCPGGALHLGVECIALERIPEGTALRRAAETAVDQCKPGFAFVGVGETDIAWACIGKNLDD